MKLFIAFAVLIAGISAMPSDDATVQTERIVTGQIVQAIEDAAQSIRDAGLDPFVIKREVFEYALPVPVIFNAAAFVEDILSTGLSDIRINRINYGLLTFRLDFDIELPNIHISAGDAYGEMTIFDNKVTAEVSGSVDINNIRVVGRANVRVGLISGVSVTNLTINFTLRSIDSNISAVVQNYNLSNFINNFVGATIPNTLQEFRPEINLLIEIIGLQIINDNL